MKLSGRSFWTILDQGLSALSNFALAVFVARSVSRTQFGEFGTVYATYAVVLGVSRALITDPLLVRFSGAVQEIRLRAIRSATGSALVFGSVTGLTMAVLGMSLGGGFGKALLAMGILMPVLLLQDAWRYSFFSQGHAWKAAINDSIWIALQVIGFIFLRLYGLQSTPSAIVVWGISAACAAAGGVLQVGVVPVISSTRSWFRHHRAYGLRYALEFIAGYGSIQIVMLALAGILGFSDVGALRGGYTVLGPLNTMMNGSFAAAVHETTRARRESEKRVLFVAVGFALVTGVVILICVSAVSQIPQSFGVQILGKTWATAKAVLVPIGLTIAANGVALGARAGTRAVAVPKRGLVLRLMVAPITAFSALMGAFIHGYLGAAWGLAIGNTICALILWTQFGLLWKHPDEIAGHLI